MTAVAFIDCIDAFNMSYKGIMGVASWSPPLASSLLPGTGAMRGGGGGHPQCCCHFPRLGSARGKQISRLSGDAQGDRWKPCHPPSRALARCQTAHGRGKALHMRQCSCRTGASRRLCWPGVWCGRCLLAGVTLRVTSCPGPGQPRSLPASVLTQ